MVDCILGNEAPPYIVIVISLSLIGSLLGIMIQYKQHGVNIYEAEFVGIKTVKYIRFFVFFTFSLLTLSLINIFVTNKLDNIIIVGIIQLFIKIFLLFSSCAVLYGVFEYYVKYKEHIRAEQ